MPQTPYFSIITVSKDNLSGLRKTCDSLLRQRSREHMEWIVIDGASNDGTPEFLLSLENGPLKPAFWSSLPDEGIYDAMNKGMAKAQGTYILFLNAGDTLADDLTVDFLHKAITLREADFIYGDSYEQVGPGAVFARKARSHEKKDLGMFTHHQAMLYKRETLADMAFNTTYKIAADYDLTLRLLEKAQGIHYIPEPLCIYESGGTSQKQAALGRKEQFQIRKTLGLVRPLRNTAIHAAQFLNSLIRKFFPRLYWHWRMQRR